MHDSKGRQIRLGDRLNIGGGIAGVVVCSIDTDEYSPNFPKDAWSYLGSGIMVQTERAGLVHLNESNEDIKVTEQVL
jgi:hypothetical protein